VYAQNPVGFFMGDDFDKALGFARYNIQYCVL
jgi:hypothetical protein